MESATSYGGRKVARRDCSAVNRRVRGRAACHSAAHSRPLGRHCRCVWIVNARYAHAYENFFFFTRATVQATLVLPPRPDCAGQVAEWWPTSSPTSRLLRKWKNFHLHMEPPPSLRRGPNAPRAVRIANDLRRRLFLDLRSAACVIAGHITSQCAIPGASLASRTPAPHAGPDVATAQRSARCCVPNGCR